ncbi:Gfo/Idh/MocA family oxidoreductase [Paenibacillus sp. IB182496]|uniref:Gfo/Idh/MocA family oxidoreductase n=1 Tax=Paenibacillus sabuli TaxID=2772509 RepID=A0A927GQW5_9BACL|nr:Gfo/Idh/MocA family oxidoreductase [Paenibacillus sabuli]MBD2844305.1 Gfo/Idh/MocA family oxidoreductase [Paenibacillus sabuli]
MSKTLNFGIIGAGTIASSHAKAIAGNPRAELYAVCDIIEENARNFAEEFEVQHVFTSLDAMLQVKELDVVNVCLPSGAHEWAVTAAARAGKHILCEKPIDIHLDKIDNMIAAVRENQVKLGCVYQRRTMPEAIAARDAVQSGKLGRMVLGDAYLKYYRSAEYYRSAGWRGTWEHDGGGALMNQGVHGIDLIQWMMGDIESVFAHTAALVRDIEVEDTAVVAVKFKSGALGVIQGATSVYPGQETRFELHGENGSFIFGDKGIQLWEAREGELKQPVVGDAGTPGADPRSIALEGHQALVEDLIEAITVDREPLINGEEARKAVAVIMAIYESSLTGKEVFLS